MSWDMIMKLPMQERRILIHKHNVESDNIERNIERNDRGGSSVIEGAAINSFAKKTQNDAMGGH